MPQRAMLRKSVTVRVPATSANLGSGLDCRGIARQLFNVLTLSTHDASGAPLAAFGMSAVGEGAWPHCSSRTGPCSAGPDRSGRPCPPY